MKKLILTVLIALTASSASADSILLENNESYWHGEKRMSEGKLQCYYYEKRKDTHYRRWHDSYQTGTTPVCPPHLEYIVWRWWTGEDSKDDWRKWQTTEDYARYNHIIETEDFIKSHGYARTVVENGGVIYSIYTPVALNFLKQVRLGYRESFKEFAQHAVETGQAKILDPTSPNYWLEINFEGEELKNNAVFNYIYHDLPVPRDFR